MIKWVLRGSDNFLCVERRGFHCSVEPSCVHKWKTIIEQGKLNEATRGACVDLSFVSCN